MHHQMSKQMCRYPDDMFFISIDEIKVIFLEKQERKKTRVHE
jgi:hypothetical protein